MKEAEINAGFSNIEVALNEEKSNKGQTTFIGWLLVCITIIVVAFIVTGAIAAQLRAAPAGPKGTGAWGRAEWPRLGQVHLRGAGQTRVSRSPERLRCRCLQMQFVAISAINPRWQLCGRG